ncbi:MAG: ammonium transporter, partial [Alphaproteobacteria bacterium]|nr:ammonium transporter [Alphaproteobacteria bacterium]
GLVPGLIAAWILNSAGVLRIPREIELVGLDIAEYHGRYLDEEQITEAERAEASGTGPTGS